MPEIPHEDWYSIPIYDYVEAMDVEIPGRFEDLTYEQKVRFNKMLEADRKKYPKANLAPAPPLPGEDS